MEGVAVLYSAPVSTMTATLTLPGTADHGPNGCFIGFYLGFEDIVEAGISYSVMKGWNCFLNGGPGNAYPYPHHEPFVGLGQTVTLTLSAEGTSASLAVSAADDKRTAPSAIGPVRFRQGRARAKMSMAVWDARLASWSNTTFSTVVPAGGTWSAQHKVGDELNKDGSIYIQEVSVAPANFVTSSSAPVPFTSPATSPSASPARRR